MPIAYDRRIRLPDPFNCRTHGMAAIAVVLLSVRVWCLGFRARILIQVTIYRRLMIGRDGYLDQSEAYDIS